MTSVVDVTKPTPARIKYSYNSISSKSIGLPLNASVENTITPAITIQVMIMFLFFAFVSFISLIISGIDPMTKPRIIAVTGRGNLTYSLLTRVAPKTEPTPKPSIIGIKNDTLFLKLEKIELIESIKRKYNPSAIAIVDADKPGIARLIKPIIIPLKKIPIALFILITLPILT